MPKKVLIIDDDLKFTAILSDKLSSDNRYKTITAGNGEEGLAAAAREMPDGILLDLLMPKMDGMEFLKRLRATEGLKQIPVLILSQLSAMAKIAEGAELGVRGYIIKSDCSLDEILRTVDDLFG